MRLHTMEITAFGPFAGTERVDFDALAARAAQIVAATKLPAKSWVKGIKAAIA